MQAEAVDDVLREARPGLGFREIYMVTTSDLADDLPYL